MCLSMKWIVIFFNDNLIVIRDINTNLFDKSKIVDDYQFVISSHCLEFLIKEFLLV